MRRFLGIFVFVFALAALGWWVKDSIIPTQMTAFDTPVAATTSPDVASTSSPAQPDGADVGHYSSAQGAEDAPRSEVVEGRRTDMDKCMATLRARRVDERRSRDTCGKIIAAIE